VGCSSGSLQIFVSDYPVRGICANRKGARVRANGSWRRSWFVSIAHYSLATRVYLALQAAWRGTSNFFPSIPSFCVCGRSLRGELFCSAQSGSEARSPARCWIALGEWLPITDPCEGGRHWVHGMRRRRAQQAVYRIPGCAYRRLITSR